MGVFVIALRLVRLIIILRSRGAAAKKVFWQFDVYVLQRGETLHKGVIYNCESGGNIFNIIGQLSAVVTGSWLAICSLFFVEVWNHAYGCY